MAKQNLSPQGYNITLTPINSNPFWDDPSGGSGIPEGGTTGQVLTKKSDEDYDTEWADTPKEIPEGGTTGQVLTKGADGVEWADPTGGGGDGLPEGGTANQVLVRNYTGGAEWQTRPGVASGSKATQIYVGNSFTIPNSPTEGVWLDSPFLASGTAGQYLRRTNIAGTPFPVEWADAPGSNIPIVAVPATNLVIVPGIAGSATIPGIRAAMLANKAVLLTGMKAGSGFDAITQTAMVSSYGATFGLGTYVAIINVMTSATTSAQYALTITTSLMNQDTVSWTGVAIGG